MAQNDFLPTVGEQPMLEKEILDIIEVNSFSKNIFAAYNARGIANKISKGKYGQANYKEYVEMLMVKYYPQELVKAIKGAEYIKWRNFLFYSFPINILFLWTIWTIIIPKRKELKKLYQI